MLKVVEFLDIEKIAAIREEYLKCGLDENDNFSLHYALFDDEKICGTGRLFRKICGGGEIVIDKISLAISNDAYYEMIFRSLLLKCQNVKCNMIFAKVERDDGFYQKFNMKKEGEFYAVAPGKIKFPKNCKKSNG